MPIDAQMEQSGCVANVVSSCQQATSVLDARHTSIATARIQSQDIECLCDHKPVGQTCKAVKEAIKPSNDAGPNFHRVQLQPLAQLAMLWAPRFPVLTTPLWLYTHSETGQTHHKQVATGYCE